MERRLCKLFHVEQLCRSNFRIFLEIRRSKAITSLLKSHINHYCAATFFAEEFFFYWSWIEERFLARLMPVPAGIWN